MCYLYSSGSLVDFYSVQHTETVVKKEHFFPNFSLQFTDIAKYLQGTYD